MNLLSILLQAATGAAQPSGGMGGYSGILMMVLIFVVFYFLLIRPQQKKAKEHQNYLANLKKGDKVITGGALIGAVMFASRALAPLSTVCAST